MNQIPAKPRRGSPLVMLALVLLSWIGGRAMIWDNPFPPGLIKLPVAERLFADSTGVHSRVDPEAVAIGNDQRFSVVASSAGMGQSAKAMATVPGYIPAESIHHSLSGAHIALECAHNLLWLQAMSAQISEPDKGQAGAIAGVTPLSPEFGRQVGPDRWSLDVWSFWREGSNAAPISQGRVPIYGASQIGANLQWRAAPSSRHDPRLFVRAYRALVANGENELAAGASVRPIGAFPVRVAAEARLTDTQFGTNIRPAVMVVTELAPQDLPAGFTLEAYGGAGYVGGVGATAFVDGQAAATRELASFNGPSESRARISMGAAAWGGAQTDASRIDVGPTVRLDLTLGEVPARVSLDWRERVSGDAAPGSGVAATLSTRF